MLKISLGIEQFLLSIHVDKQAAKPAAIIVQDQLQNCIASVFKITLKASSQNKFITLQAEKLETTSVAVVPNHIGRQISI